MKKITAFIIIAIVVIVTALSLSNRKEDAQVSADKTVAGPVIEIDLEQAMVDGPYVVVVRAQDGSEEQINVPSMGIMLCDARDGIVHPSELKVGDRVEARGTLAADGAIVPCESANHYLRKAAN